MSVLISTRLLSTQSDTCLLALARDGHERAFEALVKRYRRPLLGYCRRRLLLPEARAEDAVQTGLMRAWIALEQGTEVRDARAWLYSVTHNAALNLLRTSGYDYAQLSEALSGADAPEHEIDRRIAVREALAGLAALPPMQREALLQTAVEGRSHEDTAAALGVSEGALRGLVYRARARLRAAATAITPAPLIDWAANNLRSCPPVDGLTQVGAGGGSIGMGSLLLKGGAVMATAGAIFGTGVATHSHHRHAHLEGASAPRHVASPDTSRLASTDLQSSEAAPVPSGRARSRVGSRGGSAWKARHAARNTSRRRMTPTEQLAPQAHEHSRVIGPTSVTESAPSYPSLLMPPADGTTQPSGSGEDHNHGAGGELSGGSGPGTHEEEGGPGSAGQGGSSPGGSDRSIYEAGSEGATKGSPSTMGGRGGGESVSDGGHGSGEHQGQTSTYSQMDGSDGSPPSIGGEASTEGKESSTSVIPASGPGS